VLPSVKGSGSVSGGIDKLKSIDVFVTNKSANIIRESQWYQWKIGKDGKPTNEPKDLHNHACDAIRYSLEFIKSQMPRRPAFAAGAKIDWG
jgi:phage terminase large subunit